MSSRIAFVVPASSIAFAAMAIAGTYTATSATSAGTAASSGIVVVAAGAPMPAPTPTVIPAPLISPAPTPAAIVPARKLTKLAPLDLAGMKLWNWNGTWHASEWSNSNSPIPWNYGHIRQVENGNTKFTLTAKGSPQLQAMNATPAYGRGLWETDVTLPAMRDGLIVAPLWLYDPVSKDEVDFEYAGRNGLQVTLHGSQNGVVKSHAVRLFVGRDMSGERHRFGIKVDQAFGYVEMYLDGVQIHRWDKSKLSFFISHPVKPWIEMWAASPNNAGFVSWAGKWAGIGPRESLAMIVHGYGYSTIQ